jgi:hypothetical protein
MSVQKKPHQISERIKERKGRNRIQISVGGYAWIDLDELRMRWNPEKKMMKKVLYYGGKYSPFQYFDDCCLRLFLLSYRGYQDVKEPFLKRKRVPKGALDTLQGALNTFHDRFQTPESVRHVIQAMGEFSCIFIFDFLLVSKTFAQKLF